MSQEVNQKHQPMGGEVQGIRESRDRMERKLVESGNSPEYARQKATEAAQRWDRRRS